MQKYSIIFKARQEWFFSLFLLVFVTGHLQIFVKGLELLKNNRAKPMQKCLPTIFLFFMQIFLIPIIIAEYQILFSTS